MNFQTVKTGHALALLAATLIGACGGEKPEALVASAKVYLAKNDSKAASIQLKNALQASPNFAEARFLLGTSMLEEGNPVGAEVELRKAVALHYPLADVAPKLVEALVAQGQAGKAVDEFAKATMATPAAQSDLLMALSSAYAALGNAEASKAAVKAAFAANPQSVPAQIGQARIRASTGDFDGAMSEIDATIARTPDSQDAWKFKGDVLLYAKRSVADAMAAYRKSVALKPDFVGGYVGLAIALIAQGRYDEAYNEVQALKKIAPNNAQTRYLDAQTAFYRKDAKLAREQTQQLLRALPDNAMALQLAGAIEYQEGSLLQAEIYLSRALQASQELGFARRLLILTYLRLGQPGQALATLNAAYDKGELPSEMYAVAGQVYLQNGDMKLAEEYLSKDLKLDPKDARKRTTLALTHLLGGSAEAAFGELQAIADTDKEATADLALIAAHLRSNDYAQALAAVGRLEKKQPANPLVPDLRGRIQLSQRDLEAARVSFQRALALDAAYFPAIADLASIDVYEKKPGDARHRFEELLAKQPKNTDAMLALAKLAAATGSGVNEVAKLIGNAIAANPAEIAPRLQLIDAYLQARDYKHATSSAQEAVAALPESPDLVDALGRVQQATGDINQAIATFTKLSEMQPYSPQPHLRLAEAYVVAKNKDAAEQSLRKGLEMKPDLLEAQRALITLDFSAEKYEDAMKIARSVQRQRPKEAEGFALEGDIDVARKDWEAAAAAYRSGLKQVSSSQLAVKLHTVFVSAGKGAEADQLTASWLAEHPKDTNFLFYLGDIAIGRNDYAAAESYYLRVVRLQPDNAAALNNLAWVTVQLKKPGATAYMTRALKIRPNEAAYIDTQATLLADEGKYAEAIEQEGKALSLQPENPLFRLNLAKICISAGDKARAKAELQTLAKLGDKFPGQREVSTLLHTL